MQTVKLLVPELGGDQLFWIHRNWDQLGPLRDTSWGGLLSQVTQEAVDHAYRKWTRPLVSQLGLDPKGCLRKAGLGGQGCYNERTCTIHISDCRINSPKRPWCFEPVGVEATSARLLASKLIEAWSSNTWVLVIT